MLSDYLEHGLVAHPDGVTLRFDRDIETAVYRSLPSNMGQVIRPPFPLPVGFVGGINSMECRLAGMQATRALVGSHYTLLPGGHFLPMEAPEATADALHKTIQSLLVGQFEAKS